MRVKKTASLIKSDAMFDQIAEALGIEALDIQRVIIDLQVAHVAQVYVEIFGTDKMLDIDWTILQRAKITMLDKTE